MKGDTSEHLYRNKILQVRSEGGLLVASNGLFDLISTIESVIIKTIELKNLNGDIFFDVASALENVESLPLIGCVEHCLKFTQIIMNFYVVTRMHMICKRSNNVVDSIDRIKHGHTEKLQNIKPRRLEIINIIIYLYYLFWLCFVYI